MSECGRWNAASLRAMFISTKSSVHFLGVVRIASFHSLCTVFLLCFSHSARPDTTETYEERQHAQANQFEAQCLGFEPRVDPLLCLAEHGFVCGPDNKTDGEIVWRCTLNADRGQFVARIFYESETIRDWVSWKPEE